MAMTLFDASVRGILIERLWFDDDVVELRVSARSAHFSGVCDIYSTSTLLRDAAESIQGFPLDVNDVRTVDLATTGECGSLEFRCLDAAGHAEVSVRLLSNGEAASVVLPVNAAIVDMLREGLLRVSEGGTNSAQLYISVGVQ
jgi:hypothetical protein